MTSEFEARAARGKTAGWRYLLATALAIVVFFAASVVVIVALMMTKVMPPTISEDLLHPTRPVLFFTANGLLFGLVLLGFVAAARWVQGKRFFDVAGRWSWRLVLIGAGLWLAVEIIGALLEFAVAPKDFKFTLGPATGPLAVSAAAWLAVQTFTEEWIFRGYATQAFWLATKRKWVAAALSGLLFASLHIPNGWPQAANALVFGTITAMLAMRTGGIAFTFGLHYVNNVFAAVVVVSASDIFRGMPAGFFSQTGKPTTAIDLATVGAALLGLLWLTSSRSPFGAQLMRPRASAS